ncbi:ABC transporter substrate-binding protein [Roseomonas marmotae]|uniref:Peptide ABC transporter substrate-binding protein n=1 Tax=Roseomonas marmotae TaxID=2768161 RepID=A0ABS3KA90_9PROT|nr:ABC transporter substrate-binding protein [Roseomonas marmotae]MBO1074366.1 peptide ABC transporter substrate-binding protein [Roseomonas marmotae]QTI78112.1 peptide ABC transporter substrate-binding protein [Roseomonas marmotae]
MTPTRRALLAAGATLPFLRSPLRAQPAEGVLRFGLSTFPPNLQPWPSTGASAGTVKMLIHRRLISYDEKGELRGELAKSWANEPDGAWVFRLRKDARFQNGEPVTSEDIRWNIEQIADTKSTAYMRTQFQGVAMIETPDAHTIRIRMKEPVAALPHWFTGYNMPMIWRKSDAREPVGAGPFRVAAQERGSSIELEAVPNHWQGLPKLKRIRMTVYADENLRAAALQSGDVDMIEYVPWQSMNAVEADPRLKLDAVEGPFMDILFNGTRGPFADARVRRAVAHAVKREDIVKAAFFGRGRPLEGVPVIEGTPWYDAELAKGWAYDPARAKALLAEAGHANGFQTTLLATAQYGMHKDTAEVVQQHLAAVGIQCELRLPDWSTRVSLGTRGQYEIAIHGTSAENNDPDGLTPYFDTTLSPSHGRSFGVQAPRTVAALAKGRAEFDQEKRVEAYKEFQRAALEEVPLVGLAWRSQGYGMDRRVQGFTNLPGALTTSSGGMLEQVFFG